MSEGLVTRVKRLVAASVNEIVDTLENAAPETVMRGAIREIDQAADDVRAALGRTIANRHHASKRLMAANTKHEELGEQAQFAVAQGRDDLAEAAIARQLDMEAQIPVLESTLTDLAAEQAELESYVTALLARKREMEAELAGFLESRKAASGDGPGREAAPAELEGLAADRRAEQAESAFNRVLQGASGVAATAGADRATAAKLAELEKVAREHRVQERLAALKATKG
jgi:phage shock protein A